MKVWFYFPVALLLFGTAARADELYLKDGSKIIGTIVGFEDNSFKVQTSYGFALVEKNKIVKIVPTSTEPSKPGSKAELKKESATDAKKKPAGQEILTSEQPRPTIAPPRASEPAPVPPNLSNRPPSKSAALPLPVVEAAAPKQPEPLVNREEVRGNQYINYTYGFKIYKAPSWNIIEGTQNAMPNAIVALGTSDETTLMVIGHEQTKDSMEARASITEKQLREVYDNYRRISEWNAHVGGLPAIERHYRGTAGGHVWSGVLVTLTRGSEVFTILAMTYADSDLIQIQENVISRAIASLDFNVH